MVHLDIGDGLPLCVFLMDKMHTLTLVDESEGEAVTCPRCLEMMAEYK